MDKLLAAVELAEYAFSKGVSKGYRMSTLSRLADVRDAALAAAEAVHGYDATVAALHGGGGQAEDELVAQLTGNPTGWAEVTA